MAKDDRIRLPSSMGGLVQFEDAGSRFKIKPEHVLVLCAVVIVIVIGMHIFMP